MKQYFMMACLTGLMAVSVEASSLMGSQIRFKGRVVEKTCEVDIDSAKQRVAMRRIKPKVLYASGGKSEAFPFEIKLNNCDYAVVKNVAVKFSGTGDDELPGRLKVTGDANNVAIGLYAQNRPEVLIPLGEASEMQAITGREKILKFYAQVEAHPSALNNQAITPGTFEAVANFTLEYR